MAVNVFELFGKIGAKDEASGVIDNVISKAKAADHTLSNGLGKIGSMATSAGDKLTSTITKPAMAAAGALTSITLVKGFNRLTGIDDARAKLLGLGHDGQSVEEIMKSALASVKGTSFGMDEAATTAAGAVAAGVQSGEQLTKYLSLTADAAAIAGTSMSEMGSIINKVQTGQQAYTDDLNQLADRGLPIYQWIGQEAGVAAGEVKGLASEGKISSEMFLAAIEKNIGGAAAIMGENSFKASIANIGASIGRIGANFLDAGGKGGGFFSTLKPLMSQFNASLGGLETKATEFGLKFGQAFQQVVDKVLELKAKFDSLDPAMQSFILKSAGMWAGIAVGAGPALKIFGTFATGLSKVLAVMETFSAGATALFASLGSGMTGVVPKLLSFAGVIISILGPAAIGGALLAGLGVVQSQFGTQLDSFFQMAQTKGPTIITGLIQGINSKLPELIAQGTTLLNNFLQTITANLPAIIQGGALLIFNLVTGLAANIPRIIPVVLELVETFVQNILIVAPTLLKAGLNIIVALAQGISENLPQFIQTIAELIPLIISTLETMLPMLIEAGIAIFIAISTGIIQSIPVLIEQLPRIWEALKGAFADMDWATIGQSILDAIFLVFGELVSMLADVFSPVTDWISEKKEEITQKFSEIGSGIQNGWESTKSFFSDIADNVGNSFDSMKEKASKVPGYFEQAGKGIESGFDSAKSWLAGLPATFSETFEKVKDTLSKWGSSAGKVVSEAVGKIKGFFEENFGFLAPYLQGIFDGIVTYFTGVFELIKNVVLGPILLIITAFTGGFDQMRDYAEQIGQNILDALTLMWEGIKGVFTNSIGAVITWVVEGFTNIKDSIWQKMTEIGQAISDKWTEIMTWLSELPGRLYSWATNTFEQVKTAVSTKMSEIYNTIVTTWDTAVNWMTALPGRIWAVVSAAFTQAWNAVSEKMIAIFNTIQEKWNAAISWMSGLPGRLWSAASSAAQRMLDAVREKANEIKDKVKDGWDKAVEFLKNIDLMQLGRDAIEGFIGGITEKVSAVRDAVSSIANSVSDTISSILDIHSPSRVMKGFGVNTVEGFVDGIGDQENDVRNSMSKIAGIVKNTDLDLNAAQINTPDLAQYDFSAAASRSNTTDQSASAIVEHLQAILEVLYLLLEKDPDIILDGDSVVQKLKERLSRELSKMNNDAIRNTGLQRPEGI